MSPALTTSGAGRRMRIDPGAPDCVANLRRALAESRFLLLQDSFEGPSEVVELLSRMGSLNLDAARADGTLEVEEQAEDEVFRSNEALPLHKDGLLTGFDVAVVGIYCLDFEEVQRGRTYVSDAALAAGQMPPEDLEVLRTRGVEGQAVDRTDYYRDEYRTAWRRVPAFLEREGQPPGLHLGLPHEPGEPESWRVRVADVDEATSERVLGSLRAALLNPDYVYYHDWSVGDLLLMDNYAVLHGREAFAAKRRRLANIQVLAP